MAVEVAEPAVAVARRVLGNILLPQDRQRDVLALELTVDERPIGLGMAPRALLRAGLAVELLLEHRIVSSSGSGHENPASATRANVSRTVDAAIPRLRAIALWPISAPNLSSKISRTCRIATLSAGITPPPLGAKG
jgi:hypothetical protein